jgi:hypothetical protein
VVSSPLAELWVVRSNPASVCGGSFKKTKLFRLLLTMMYICEHSLEFKGSFRNVHNYLLHTKAAKNGAMQLSDQ